MRHLRRILAIIVSVTITIPTEASIGDLQGRLSTAASPHFFSEEALAGALGDGLHPLLDAVKLFWTQSAESLVTPEGVMIPVSSHFLKSEPSHGDRAPLVDRLRRDMNALKKAGYHDAELSHEIAKDLGKAIPVNRLIKFINRAVSFSQETLESLERTLTRLAAQKPLRQRLESAIALAREVVALGVTMNAIEVKAKVGNIWWYWLNDAPQGKAVRPSRVERGLQIVPWLEKEKRNRSGGFIADSQRFHRLVSRVLGTDMSAATAAFGRRYDLRSEDASRLFTETLLSEIAAAYATLQRASRPLSDDELWRQIRQRRREGLKAPAYEVLGIPYLSRLFDELEAGGFALRRHAEKGWAVEGLARAKILNVAPYSWDEDSRKAWEALGTDESAAAIAQRIGLIMKVNSISWEDMGGLSVKDVLGDWRRGDADPHPEALDRDVVKYAARLGVESIVIRRGTPWTERRDQLFSDELEPLSIGQKVIQIRHWQGITRHDLRERAGVHMTTSWNLEHEDVPLRNPVYFRLAKTLGVSIALLMICPDIPELPLLANALRSYRFANGKIIADVAQALAATLYPNDSSAHKRHVASLKTLISRWENGVRPPVFYHVSLAELLERPVDVLFAPAQLQLMTIKKAA